MKSDAAKADKMITIDGNTAVANVAHAINEVIAIYPITPSSGMGEISDAYSAAGKTNIWGTIPNVTEMQSEAGAAGAVHGAVTTGALATTFTASQGLLLMIPNMFKIAGELTSTVFNVSARAVSTHALSIFGDHSDIMAIRSTGFGLLLSGSVQEAMDMTLIAQASSLESRVPLVHAFDGFRTSHEIQKIYDVPQSVMKEMITDKMIQNHRANALTPDKPTLKGTSQNPDVFFQSRETVNKYYLAMPSIVQKKMDQFAKLTGRQYHLFDYVGAPDADRVIVIMGSGAECVHETVNYLNANGEKVGLLKVRLYRPFDADAIINALPKSVKKIAVLDRTKEPGALGEPMYLDIQSSLREAGQNGGLPFDSAPVVVGGRYGLGSKDYTPADVKGIYDNLKADKPKNHFTVSIIDDVTNTSLEYDRKYDIEPDDVYRALFYGLGSDGTVGANKNTIKIIGENTENYAQGYFVYDSKKAGAITVSHVRFSKKEIRSPYLISKANLIACHNFSFLEKYDMLSYVVDGGTFLLNSPYSADEVWDNIPKEVQQQIVDKKLDFYVIDGLEVAKKLGLGARINMIMQTAFFLISGILTKEQSIEQIKDAIKKTYGSKGEKVVNMNYAAVDAAQDALFKVDNPSKITSKITMPPVVPSDSPEFVQNVTAEIIAGRGDDLPVSAFPVDGTYMTGTTQFEKRNIAVEIPVWDEDLCIQCGQCVLICPHAAILQKAYQPSILDKSPKTFKSADANGGKFKGMKYTIQVAPEDCTGCVCCVNICPAFEKDDKKQPTGHKAINMAPQPALRKQEAENFKFFLDIPETDTSLFKIATIKGSQFIKPLFEFSGACSGCGETPYVKLLTQLFGDRALIGNATGCSSIYGGNLPTTPFTKRADGRGPAWSNSLFEDCAEFAMGMRLTVDKMQEFAFELLKKLVPEDYDEIKNAAQSTPNEIETQRDRVTKVKEKLAKNNSAEAKRLIALADYLVNKSVWGVGGDGWAYDIGYGGLDHVIASGKNVNLLVLDTEVYSNTGGQMSKSTPRGAIAQFAAAGKPLAKKDLVMMAMAYGSVYVARVAMGSSQNQVVKAFAEAEAFDGPSLIVAYSHCIAHGINMSTGFDNQDKAVKSGHWPLMRFNPDNLAKGKNPLMMDSKPPSIPYSEYTMGENRWRSLKAIDPERAAHLAELAQNDVSMRFSVYDQLSKLNFDANAETKSDKK
ncbi:MAG: pyruvate:ferredoxin (flavodoxin) oxidoreductase [candidate division Zixibacteria bacterium]|nr:pyruvate:ferredoxin (flavodoxin) oxidoreductase [candidate division Zixibacteria bacterium]